MVRCLLVMTMKGARISLHIVFLLFCFFPPVYASGDHWGGSGRNFSFSSADSVFISTHKSKAYQGQQDYKYRAELIGVSGNLRTIIEQKSALITGSGESFPALGFLNSRIDQDQKLIEKILRSEGYYNGNIQISLTREVAKFIVKISVKPGKQYKINQITLSPPPPLAETVRQKLFSFIPPSPGEGLIPNLPAQKGSAAQASLVLETERSVVARLPQIGYPFAHMSKRNVIVDHATKSMDINFDIDYGELRLFGKTNFTENPSEKVSSNFLNQLIPYDQNQLFDARKLDTLRRRLKRSGLFNSVVIKKEKGEDNTVDIAVDLTSNKPKSIGLGAGYSNNTGFQLDGSFEHTNLFGGAEKFRVDAVLAEIEQSLILDFRKPHLGMYDRNIFATLGAQRDDTDAFEASRVFVRTGVEQPVFAGMLASLSAEIERTEITEMDINEGFTIFAVSAGLSKDTRDDPLDSTEGFRVSYFATPLYSLGETNDLFIKNELTTSFYFSLLPEKKAVLALRSRFGAIHGGGTQSVPADRRFFAGGGGSIRGFGFQSVGPRGQEERPIGGRSTAEVGAEIRLKITDTIGIVPFLEAGNVYNSNLPTFGNLAYGAGLGFRYYTSFGPIRFDIATPLNPRSGDNPIQLYISIGQAF